MPTLKQVFDELKVRQARLKRAKDEGHYWDDEPCQQNLREIENTIAALFTQPEVMDKLIERAGDLDLGDLPYSWVILQSDIEGDD